MQKTYSNQKVQEAETKLRSLEYELVGKHLEEYKEKLDKMSDSEIHQILFERIVESLREQKRLTKTSLQQQVIACMSQKYWEKIEKDLDQFFKSKS